MSHARAAHWALVEYEPDGIRICRGDHGDGTECEWEYFVPKAPAVAALLGLPEVRRPRVDVLDDALVAASEAIRHVRALRPKTNAGGLAFAALRAALPVLRPDLVEVL